MKAPSRKAFGDEERLSLLKCIEYYVDQENDPPYDGVYQKKWESLFSKKMGGGYCVAVSSGSNASYIALKALELKKRTVLMSPVTDTSSLLSILMAGYLPVIVDTAKDSYNSSLEYFQQAYRSDVGAIYLVHTYGVPADVKNIKRFCEQKQIALIEDCSQAPFAKEENQYVGTFGEIAVVSTMYRKTLNTSSSGGIVFTRNEMVYRSVIEYSDRGRRKWDEKSDARDGGDITRLSLNFNIGEFSSAVGIASLGRVDEVIRKRTSLIRRLETGLKSLDKFLSIMKFPDGCSPFLVPIVLTQMGLDQRDNIFRTLHEYEIPFASTYPCFAFDWQITQKLRKMLIWDRILAMRKRISYHHNAEQLKAKSFNIFMHEGYTDEYIDYIIKALAKALAK